MTRFPIHLAVKRSAGAALLVLMLSALPLAAQAPVTTAPATTTPVATSPAVPDWSIPYINGHKQVPPPADFHRPTTTFHKPIGIFKGQSDVGSALAPGSASFDPATKQYSITSAGYNIWYTRDEFRFLWKKMSGDVSIAADVSLIDPKGYFDRKVVLIIRKDLDDDSKEAMVAEHGYGMVHLSYRPEKGVELKETYHLLVKPSEPHPKRIGIEKHGDTIRIFGSMAGEPMKQMGSPITLHIDGPFYVGLGFTSHLPATTSRAVFSNVVLKNSAGEVH